MSKKEPEYIIVDDSRSAVLIARILWVYLLTVIGVVLLIVNHRLPLLRGDLLMVPTGWLWLVFFLYYALPLIVSLIFGAVFRPFGKNFLKLWLSILALQLLYSATMNLTRFDYVEKFRAKSRWVAKDQFVLSGVTAQYSDTNGDGWHESVEIWPELSFPKSRYGSYLIRSSASLNGGLGPDIGIGLARFEIRKGTPRDIKVRFAVSPANWGGRELQHVFTLKLFVDRQVQVDEYGRRLLLFTRWSPFLRDTAWDGHDPRIHDDLIPVGQIEGKDLYTLASR